MSVEVMGIVYKKKLGSHSRKAVMLKMADHADVDGQCSWPSVALISLSCEISPRTVQRALSYFVEIGLLIVVEEGGKGPFHTTEYAINLEALNALPPAYSKGDMVTPLTSSKGDTVTPLNPSKGDTVTDKGDMVTPKPLVTIKRKKRAREALARAASQNAIPDMPAPGERGKVEIKIPSEQWDAWKPLQSEFIRKYVVTKKLDMWAVPSEWPPGHRRHSRHPKKGAR